MKRVLDDPGKRPYKKFRCASFLDRVRAFLQWLPVGVPDIVSSPQECPLPPTQAWSRTCPDYTLRCPGCGQYLEAPVKQCVNGHSLCSNCRRLLYQCPTCRGHFLSTPQPVLDRLLSTTRLPCLYAAFGCPVLEVLRRRDEHGRTCAFRPSTCPLCSWETPPPPQNRPREATGEQLLARHMTSVHRHHALQLDKEHELVAWLELKEQTSAFLSCAMTVDTQVFVFVMNYDTKRRKFFVVLKYIGSQENDRRSPKSRSGTPQRSATGLEEPPLESESEEFSSCENTNIDAGKDSFERTKREEIFRRQDSEYCYLVELVDSKGVQSVRLAQAALNQDDALDLAVKSGRCLSVDFSLLDRLLEPGNGQFSVKLTISRIQSNLEEFTAANLKKNLNPIEVPKSFPIT